MMHFAPQYSTGWAWVSRTNTPQLAVNDKLWLHNPVRVAFFPLLASNAFFFSLACENA